MTTTEHYDEKDGKKHTYPRRKSSASLSLFQIGTPEKEKGKSKLKIKLYRSVWIQHIHKQIQYQTT